MGDRQLLLLALLIGHIKGCLPSEFPMPEPLAYQCTYSLEVWDNGQPKWVPHGRDPSGHPGDPPGFSGTGLPSLASRFSWVSLVVAHLIFPVVTPRFPR